MTTTSRLDWRWASDHLYFAQGVRGRYKIVRVDPQSWTLYGVEPGGLTMMALPVTGKGIRQFERCATVCRRD